MSRNKREGWYIGKGWKGYRRSKDYGDSLRFKVGYWWNTPYTIK